MLVDFRLIDIQIARSEGLGITHLILVLVHLLNNCHVIINIAGPMDTEIKGAVSGFT